MCKIGEIVVVGGVRRSALISLSNLSDDQMRHAKSGEWYDEPERGIFRDGQRGLANNSVAYKGKPEMGTFMREWLALYDSKSGERGIFNREAADASRWPVTVAVRQDTCGARIPVVKLSCVRISSATCQKLSYVRVTRSTH